MVFGKPWLEASSPFTSPGKALFPAPQTKRETLRKEPPPSPCWSSSPTSSSSTQSFPSLSMSGICVSVNLKNNHLQDDGHPHFSISDLKKKKNNSYVYRDES